jgi:two-component system NarL family sensor kinase
MKPMRIHLLLSLYLLPIAAFSQQSWIDSIRAGIPQQKNDTEVIRSWINLCNRLRITDTVEALKCRDKVDSMARASGKEYFRGLSFFTEGLYQLSKDHVRAGSSLEKAIHIFLQFPNDPNVILSLSAAYINLGVIHSVNGDYPAAIDHFLHAEHLLPRSPAGNDKLSIIYSNLSDIYGVIKKSEEALLYSKRSLDLAHLKNDKQRLMKSYFSYGTNLVLAKKAATGLPYLDSALHLSRELNDLSITYLSMVHIGMYYFDNKRFDTAYPYLLDCLAFAKASHNAMFIQDGYINLAENETKRAHYAPAAAYLDSFRHVNHTPTLITLKAYYDEALQLYEHMGDYKKALAYSDSASHVKDSMYQQDNIRQIEFRQARYAHEKQQNEIDRLEDEKKLQALALSRKNIVNYFLLTAIVTLSIISFLYYRNHRQKQKLQQQRIAEFEREKQLAATEAVLKGEEQERTRLAKDLHDGLGGMLSGIKHSFNSMKNNLIMSAESQQLFRRSLDMLDSSIREMRRVAHNLMPEALLKFGLDAALKDFFNDIDGSGALQVRYQSIGMDNAVIDQTTAITIYRVIQELISNAIKHAAARNMIVQLSRIQSQISVTVEDDGKGFNTNVLSQSKGIGWTNIFSRIEFLKGSIDVQSQPGTGTSVLIELHT